MEKTVIELFAGVGGFRVGLNEITSIDNDGKAIEKNNFKFVWANQWEPSTKIQHAFNCYQTRFADSSSDNCNEDISLVNKKEIPDHSLICGGFPCQDYSVARSLSQEKGIEGKKGVLWWQINDILKEKKTPFVLLENVDRLVKSPSKQRGRDFGIMLRCLSDLGYAVEWRIINAADYGHPQRRRRIYIFAYKKGTKFYNKIVRYNATNVISKVGMFAQAFPIEKISDKVYEYDVNEYEDLVELSTNFKANFENAGFMKHGKIYTTKTVPVFENPITLSEIIEENAPKEYYLSKDKLKKFSYLRGSKKILRTSKEGINYYYSEGSMSPVDSLQLPGRTMLTSEGSINRSTHIIDDPKTNKRRLLTPIECERLNQFPDNWTDTMPVRNRYFMMGNALVCGIIKKSGKIISSIIDNEK